MREGISNVGAAVSLERAAQILKSAANVLIICHKHPDGDTLGSALALASVLTEIGIRSEVICADPPPPRFTFMTAVKTSPTPSFTPDLTVTVDVASPGLLGKLEEKYADRIDLKLDHHAIGAPFAKENYVDATAAGCGEIIFELSKLLSSKPIPKDALDMLYLAISADSGGLRFTNTTPKTLRIAAELMECGADTAEINRILFESRTPSEVRAISAAYAGMRYYLNGTAAITVFTNEAKKQLDITDDDISAVSGLSREIAGVTLGITLRQSSEDLGKYKASLRTVAPVDAAAICSKLGGGGHVRAAGAEFFAASPEEAVEKILAAAGIPT